jgi:X box-binding protein 1
MSSPSEYSILGGHHSDEFDSDGGGGPRKRRRLTHLSPDEKMLRRKLKNRVAAQTARDRKKALMAELEEKVAQLEEENKLLRRQNVSLKETSTCLAKENAALKTRLSDPVEHTSMKTDPEPIRSAAPAVPLQKEQVQNLSRWMAQYCALIMMLSLMISSAYYKSLTTSESASSRKRKQTRPSRRVSHEEVVVIKQEVMVKEEPRNPHDMEWWGSHQQSWNPSMN